ncbi:uncharacterized protein LOC119170841 isoform X2 [Rhipicephalus microplus]|uniref:uncharacterized protein LOC119170841 isoform X2 n=1 Tax=Rhipicephalus microplus TaxID=6941 RepID=UPI003F6B98E7
MTWLLVIFFLVIHVCDTVVSCPANEELGVCDGGGLFPQNYCDGVAYYIETWTCKRRKKSRCVCKGPLWRNKNGRCVHKDDCETHRREVVQKPERPPARKPQGSPNKTPENLKPSPEYFDTVLKFIRKKQTIYLLMGISGHLPNILSKIDICLRSAYITDFDSGALRTLSGYKDVQLIHALAEFFLGGPEHGKVVINIKLDETDIPAGSSSLDIQEKFFVLDVQDDCLLLAYGSWSSHMTCLSLGFDPETKKCHESAKRGCRSDMTDFLGESGSCRTSEVDFRETISDDLEQAHGTSTLKEVANAQITINTVEEFLQSEGNIYLQKVHQDDWMKTDCECVQSAYEVSTLSGSYRTLECSWSTKMKTEYQRTKIEGRVEFLASTEDGLITVEVKPIVGLEPLEGKSSVVIPPCTVLEASANCVLLSYGQSDNGKQKCLLLGLSSRTVDTTTQCNKKLESVCTALMSDLTESHDPCDHYEEEE